MQNANFGRSGSPQYERRLTPHFQNNSSRCDATKNEGSTSSSGRRHLLQQQQQNNGGRYSPDLGGMRRPPREMPSTASHVDPVRFLSDEQYKSHWLGWKPSSMGTTNPEPPPPPSFNQNSRKRKRARPKSTRLLKATRWKQRQSAMSSLQENPKDNKQPCKPPDLVSNNPSGIDPVATNKSPPLPLLPSLLPACSSSNISDSLYIRAVIDTNHPEGSITRDQWTIVERALSNHYKQFLEKCSGAPPQITDIGWLQGRVKLVSCANERSLFLYETVISELGELWPGCSLKVVAKDSITNSPWAQTYIPDEPSHPNEVLEIIQLSNPDLSTRGWKVALIGEAVGQRREAVIILADDAIVPLHKKKGIIFYGFTSIALNVFGAGVNIDPEDQQNATSTLCSEETEMKADSREGAVNGEKQIIEEQKGKN